jgi:hypothetical protein
VDVQTRWRPKLEMELFSAFQSAFLSSDLMFEDSISVRVVRLNTPRLFFPIHPTGKAQLSSDEPTIALVSIVLTIEVPTQSFSSLQYLYLLLV